MALSNTTVRAEYNGDGSTTTFAIPAALIEDTGSSSTEVKVYIRDTSTDPVTETLQTISTHYTLTGGPPVANVEFVSAPPTGTKNVVIIRQLTIDHDLNLNPNSAIDVESLEDKIDRMTALAQQMQEQLDRCVKLDITSAITGLSLEDPTAERYLRVSSDGTRVESVVGTGEINPPVSSTDNAVVRWDGTGATAVQDSGVTIDDSDNVDIPGDLQVDGNAIIDGNLTVSGTTTTINTSTIDLEDPNITLNNGQNQAAADTIAGVTVEMSDATDVGITYDDTSATKWKAGEIGSEVDLVGISSTQTLTNKTIDSDNNTITNIVNADIKAAAAIDADKIHDGSVSNTEFGYLDGVTSAIQTQLDAKIDDHAGTTDNALLRADGTGGDAIQDSGIIIDDSDNVTEVTSMHVGTGAIDASSSLEVTSTSTGFLGPRMTEAQRDAIGTPAAGLEVFNTTTNKPNFYNGTVWQEIGEGTGNNLTNYITNSDAEVNVDDWATYADAAGVQPVDGTGGSPTVTLTRTTSSPLMDVGSFLITKDAADRQGEGISFDFDIDNGYKSKVLRISCLYEASVDFAYNAGTAADPSDIVVYIYDVTNSQLIQPTGFTLDGSGSFLSEFQAASDSTSYRLIFHVATTNASAWTFKLDNISCGPREIARGPIITDWVEYTPTASHTSGSITSATYSGKWRRVGGMLEAIGEASITTTGTWTGLFFSIPSGLTVDESKVTSNLNDIVGDATLIDAGTTNRRGIVRYSSGLDTKIELMNDASDAASALTQAVLAGGMDKITWSFKVPIQGWGSNTVLSSDAGLRSVVFSGTQTSEAVTANTTNITFASEKDSHGGWATNIYTVQEPGDYQLNVVGTTTVTGTNFRVYKNASASKFIAGSAFASGRLLSGSVVMPNLVSGDTIAVRSTETATISDGSFSINKIQSPQTIGMNEFVGAVAKTLSSTTITSGTGLILTTVLDDSHGAYDNSSGAYICPVPGRYSVKYAGTFLSSGSCSLQVHVNGSDYFSSNLVSLNSAGRANLAATVKCEAGDTIEIVPQSSVTAGSTDGVVSFTRIN